MFFNLLKFLDICFSIKYGLIGVKLGKALLCVTNQWPKNNKLRTCSQDRAIISCCLAVSPALNTELGIYFMMLCRKKLFTVFHCDSPKRKKPWLIQTVQTLTTSSINLSKFMTKFLVFILYFHKYFLEDTLGFSQINPTYIQWEFV